MDIKKIKKLINLVETSDISSLCVEEDQLKIEIKKNNGIIQTTTPVTTIQTEPAKEATTKETTEKTSPEFTEIKSPMVGTFYGSQNPETHPFVTENSSIKVGDTICIIEAMKLFNEIEAEQNGVIEKICVNNGDAVEFGQTLFLVRPK